MNAAMKTPITVLQEMVVKLGETAEYECVSQSGPDHSKTFEYRCTALGSVATATAGSKKEAKQEVARKLLLVLAAKGTAVPPPYCLQLPTDNTTSSSSTKSSVVGANSYVALLKEMCIEYHLPAVEYELVADSGPPHHRMFTIKAKLGQHERLATAGAKKTARQMAAEQLYTYMRENLSRLTKDFVEEEALMRQHERAMERYVELRDENTWRPDLGQRIADYHLGLVQHIEAEKCQLALRVLEEYEESGTEDYEEAVNKAVEALGLTLTKSSLQSRNGNLPVLELSPTSPALAFCARSLSEAYRKAAEHIRLALS